MFGHAWLAVAGCKPMELYFKDFISEDASLDRLVDDLMLVVQGANELAAANGAGLGSDTHHEITGRLRALKRSCYRAKQQAIRTALATDKLMHQYPYSSAGFALAFGLALGMLLKRRS